MNSIKYLIAILALALVMPAISLAHNGAHALKPDPTCGQYYTFDKLYQQCDQWCDSGWQYRCNGSINRQALPILKNQAKLHSKYLGHQGVESYDRAYQGLLVTINNLCHEMVRNIPYYNKILHSNNGMRLQYRMSFDKTFESCRRDFILAYIKNYNDQMDDSSREIPKGRRWCPWRGYPGKALTPEQDQYVEKVIKYHYKGPPPKDPVYYWSPDE